MSVGSILAPKPDADAFFVTGGTLRPDAASYIPRKADADLFASMTRGEFCYVLNSRQMGKSSLMVRVSHRLRAQSREVAVLDLTRVGRNVSPEQWYYGLALDLGAQLRLTRQVREHWQNSTHLGPLQRWLDGFDKVILPGTLSRVAIFIDEIDYVRSLPFDTDEFFAAIRELHNRRASNANYDRLVFCLLGVATPAELIADTRMTPFNIGTRIELADFSLEEARPLAEALHSEDRNGHALIERVFYWTEGHPFLTQRLCRALAERPDVGDNSEVDRLCRELFLSDKAKTSDDNLAFVQHRVLRSEDDPTALLELYDEVRAGKIVRNSDSDHLIGLLKLTGIVKAKEGLMVVRNRIYAQAFDHEWVISNLPTAVLLRAKRAYWQGLRRAAGVAGIVLAGMAALAVKANSEAQYARSLQGQLTVQAERMRRELYAAHMMFAHRDLEEGRYGSVVDYLRGTTPEPGQLDLRGFEWMRLSRLSQASDHRVLQGHTNGLRAVTYSPDGKYIASGGLDGKLILWDANAGVVVKQGDPGDQIDSFAFMQDGSKLLVGRNFGKVELVDIPSLAVASSVVISKTMVMDVACVKGFVVAGDAVGNIYSLASPSLKLFSQAKVAGNISQITALPNNLVAVSSEPTSGNLTIFDLGEDGQFRKLRSFEFGGGGLAVSPDKKTLFVGDMSGQVRSVSLENWSISGPWRANRSGVPCLVAMDGNTVAVGNVASTILLFDEDGRQQVPLLGHSDGVWSMAMSPEGERLASASYDGTVRVWTKPETDIEPDLGRTGTWVQTVKWLPDSSRLLAAERDGTLSLRSRKSGEVIWSVRTSVELSMPLAVLPEKNIVAAGGDKGLVTLFSLKDGSKIRELDAGNWNVRDLSFSPDGRYLAAAADNLMKLWETRSWTELVTPEMAGAQALAFSPDSTELAVGGRGTRVSLISLPHLTIKTIGPAEDYYGFRFAPSGAFLLGTTATGSVVTINLSAGDWKSKSAHPGPIYASGFSPDGKTYATGGEGGSVILWNSLTNLEVGRLEAGSSTVLALDFSPDGTLLTTGGKDARIRLWYAGKEDR